MLSPQTYITEKERDLIFDISQGNHKIIRMLYDLRSLWLITKKAYPYFEVLNYLKTNKIVGQAFADQLTDIFSLGIVGAASELQKNATKDFKLKKLYA